MQIDGVPPALLERLGREAAGGLLQLMDATLREERDTVVAACTDRFERRMVDEVSGVRVQLAQVESAIRQDMVKLESGLRQDMGRLESGLRQEMTALEAGLRQDMVKLETGLRQDMGVLETGLRQDMGALETGLRQDMMKLETGLRKDLSDGLFELLKWSFLFWIGQVVAISTIIAVMLRLAR